MSHAANYLWISGGRTLIATSRWGAPALPRDVFWGPETLFKLIDAMADEHEAPLYGELMCEGAVLVDADHRLLLLFGGEDLAGEHLLQRAYVEMLSVVWAGWRVRWAYGGMADIARAAGVEPRPEDPEPLPAASLRPWRAETRAWSRGSDGRYAWHPHPDPWNRPLDDEMLYFNRSECSFCVITSHGPSGTHDHPIAGRLATVLAHGPGLRELLADHPPVPPSPALNDANGGAVVDWDARTLRYWTGWAEPSWLPGRLREAWPGWSVDRDDRGLAAQFTTTGRDPAAVAVDPALLRRFLIRTVFAERDSDAIDELLAGIAERAARPGVALAPDVLSNPRANPDAAMRLRLLAGVLAHLESG